MRPSPIAVKVMEHEGGDIFYDPIVHGRTLKVFGMDDYPRRFLGCIASEYADIGYSRVVFDTTGEFEGDFETVIEIRDGEGTGIDPIKFALDGLIDPYSAATIVQTIYGLDRALTDRLYADILFGKVKSVPDAAKAGEKYSEVILEAYTPLDEIFYSGEIPKLEGDILVNLGGTHSITLVGIAFLTLAAAFEKKREVMVGLLDAAVLGYTSAGSAAMSLFTRPLRKRITVVASQYVLDSLLNLPGPTVLLYHDPDLQALVYESNGVPPGPMRKFVHKGSGAFIVRSPETIDVFHGRVFT